MKRLCVYYRMAEDSLGKENIEWIICKECQKKLRKGEHLAPGYGCTGRSRPTAEEYPEYERKRCAGDGFCHFHNCVHYEY